MVLVILLFIILEASQRKRKYLKYLNSVVLKYDTIVVAFVNCFIVFPHRRCRLMDAHQSKLHALRGRPDS